MQRGKKNSPQINIVLMLPQLTRHFYSNKVWQNIKSLLPRSFKPPPSPPTTHELAEKIATTPQHSIAAMSREAVRQQYLAQCAAFTRISLRTAFVRYSPQKLNEVARLLPGLSLPQALMQMRGQERKAARLAIIPLLHNAMNAVRQRGKSIHDFHIEQAMVGRGRYRKRLDIKGRGRMGIKKRPSCFLRLVVSLPNKAKALKAELRRHVCRVMRKQFREDKPVYLRLRY